MPLRLMKEREKVNKMRVFCPECNQETELVLSSWRCRCGGAWEPLSLSTFAQEKIRLEKAGLWRYIELFGLDFSEPTVCLGAGWTPLIEAPFRNREVHFKVEYFSPTGSFKDRGTEVEINVLNHMGAKKVVDDSAGNAGSSLAAYAARADIEAEIFVPHYASENKKKQITVYGAKVNSVYGLRENAKKEAIKSIQSDTVYASHAYHPCFLLGQESVAWEIWEQLGRQAPDWYVVPVGQGVHLLGAWLGFLRLKEAGLISKVPRLAAVQPALLNPIIVALKSPKAGLPDILPAKPSIAEGLAITKPVRWKRIVNAIQASEGIGISVEEEDISQAQQDFGRMGFYIEPTSATVIAALPQVFEAATPSDVIVAGLTGTGLKGAPKID